MNPETDYRLRLYIERVLVDEEWFDTSDPECDVKVAAAADRHAAMCAAADKPFHLEFYDPALPEDRAYRRIGTDGDAMIDPSEPMPVEQAVRLAIALDEPTQGRPN